mmetsp:Transcript_15733/g.18190  ORF Transcript_15733/g.18190 Transcript_15733/m.18190 type:complete len:304 (-) Transcript_15733:39-950(-)
MAGDNEGEDDDDDVDLEDLPSEKYSEKLPPGAKVTVVKVQSKRKVYELVVEEDITVGSLKSFIQKINHVHPEDQAISYDCETLDDNQSLASCCITGDSCLNLFEVSKMVDIYVATNKDEMAFNVKWSSTVEYIKKQIYEINEIPVYNQILLFKGNQLMDCSTLRECGIEDESILTLNIIEDTFWTEEPEVKLDDEESKDGSEYSNLIDIMNFDGSWDEKILKVIARTETELLKNMPDQVRKLKTRAEQLRAMYTLEGMKLLKTKFKASDQELKLILKKIVDYLEKNQLENYYQLFGSSEFGVN